jgi:hypothetical protein
VVFVWFVTPELVMWRSSSVQRRLNLTSYDLLQAENFSAPLEVAGEAIRKRNHGSAEFPPPGLFKAPNLVIFQELVSKGCTCKRFGSIQRRSSGPFRYRWIRSEYYHDWPILAPWAIGRLRGTTIN